MHLTPNEPGLSFDPHKMSRWSQTNAHVWILWSCYVTWMSYIFFVCFLCLFVCFVLFVCFFFHENPLLTRVTPKVPKSNFQPTTFVRGLKLKHTNESRDNIMLSVGGDAFFVKMNFWSLWPPNDIKSKLQPITFVQGSS